MRVHFVVSSLRQAISRGDFAPGHKLNEEVLRGTFEVSRNTLREAFATLESEKLVERIMYRGVFIVDPAAAAIRDIFRARSIVEPAALLWGKHCDFQALHEIISRAKQPGASTQEIADCNQRFHRLLVESAGSDCLIEHMDQILARMRLVFMKMTALRPDFHLSYVTINAEILRLLEAGQRHDAAALLQDSLASTCEEIIQALD